MAGVSKGVDVITGATSLDGLLKDFYGPRIAEQLNNSNFALDRLEKRKDMKWSGRQVKFPIHTQRNSGVGFRSESGSLPDAGGQNYEQASITDVLFYGTIQLTGLAMDSVLSDRGGFRRALDSEMRGLVNDAKDHFGSKIFGFGQAGANVTAGNKYNGLLGQCKDAAVAGSGTDNDPWICQDMDNPLGYLTSDWVPAQGQTRYFKAGQKVAFGSSVELGATMSGVGTVKSVVDSTTIQVTGTGNAPDTNDFFVMGSKVGVGNYEFENGLNGLGSLIPQYQNRTNAAFQGITCTTGQDYTWQSYNLNVNGAFDEVKLHQTIHNIEEVGAGSPSLLVSHYTLLKEYYDDVLQNVQFTSSPNFSGGYQTLKFSSDREYDWVVDKYCPYGVMYILDESALFWAVRRDFGWDDRGGAILKSLAVTGDDAVRAFYKAYLQLGFESLNAHGTITRQTVSGMPT
tara:strand:- start:904 stop:2271 length:1368 start_codon:yes stop_codon:yes gene_type:complete